VICKYENVSYNNNAAANLFSVVSVRSLIIALHVLDVWLNDIER